MYEKILVSIAIADELPIELPLPYIKIITGLGKVNAAISITAAINEHHPTKVINYGTAGTLNKESYGKGLHRVSCVMQRDMDCRPIGYDLGKTPYDDTDVVINLGIPGPSLSTGDDFVTCDPELVSDLVDMEAYSIVKSCTKHNIPVEIYKYISDSADESASDEWNSNISNGVNEFCKVINVTNT